MKSITTHTKALLVAFMLLTAVPWFICIKESSDDLPNISIVANDVDWLESIKKETVNRTVQAKLLIQPHFPKHDLIILNSRPAPGGSLIVTTSINSKERTFIVLADNKNFVEGVLNSPYLNSNTVTPQHTQLTQERANSNSAKTAKFEALKADFKKDGQKSTNMKNTAQTTHMNKSQVQEAFVMPEVSTSTPQATKRDILEEAKLLDAVTFGNKNAPSVYVFFDLQCPACLLAHKTLEKLTLEGLLKVHYIPVGIQNKESIVRTAYSLIPTDNSKRQVVFNHMKKQIPIEQLLTSKANESELKIGLIGALKNKKVFVKLPNPATPTFLYEHNGISYISIVTSTGDIKNIVRLLNN
jgi:hypothetical protein